MSIDDNSGRNDLETGPVMASYETYSLNTEGGVIMAAGSTDPTQCILSLDPLPVNGITLMQGMQPLGPVISMTSTGIKIAIGGPVGASIELSAKGLKLAFGPPVGGSSISMDAMGITLKAGLTNQVQLGQQGLNMQSIKVAIQALAAMQVQAMQLTETIAGPVSRTGGITTMV